LLSITIKQFLLLIRFFQKNTRSGKKNLPIGRLGDLPVWRFIDLAIGFGKFEGKGDITNADRLEQTNRGTLDMTF
jgi:hypothetical protein